MDSDDSDDLITPFVVCESNDGPYDDVSFAAGVQFGEIAALIRLTPMGVRIRRYIYPEVVPQVDLLVMCIPGAHMRVDVEEGSRWVLVEIQVGPFSDEWDDD